ncbi:MAG: hypothetical protein C0594_03695, partial [Marinilabiliales bacterium]
MNKSVLIFGAGLNQVSLIKACNHLGYRSVVIDPNSDPPGKKYASVFEVVDPFDYDRTKSIAECYQVDGIVTSQMENPLKLMARLAKEKAYIFNSPEVIERSTNKFLMKKVLLRNGISCAKGYLFNNESEFLEVGIKDLFFPLIIKPKDSHSSRGVFLAEDYKSLKNYIPQSASYSSDGSYIIEEYIEGREYSIESVTYNGFTTIIQITEKIVTPFPYNVELGHIQPAQLSDIERQETENLVIKVISSLGLDNTVSHAEVKLSKDGPYLIEIGARMGGDFISSYLTKTSTGVDLDKAAVQLSIGIEPDLEKKEESYSYISYITLEKGKRVVSVEPIDDILNNEDVVIAGIFVSVEDVITEVTHSAQRSGYI